MENEEEYYSHELEGLTIRVFEIDRKGDPTSHFKDMRIDMFYIANEGFNDLEHYTILAEGNEIIPADPYQENTDKLIDGDLVKASCNGTFVAIMIPD